MNYQFKYVNGHIEVFDDRGAFLFSADDWQEAQEEIENAA